MDFFMGIGSFVRSATEAIHEKGAHLLALHHRHRNAHKRNAFSTPQCGARLWRCVLLCEVSCFVVDSSRSRAEWLWV